MLAKELRKVNGKQAKINKALKTLKNVRKLNSGIIGKEALNKLTKKAKLIRTATLDHIVEEPLKVKGDESSDSDEEMEVKYEPK
jgi:hypothetical protein